MSSDLRALPTGTCLSDYRLERVLGHGGFGITYLATDLSLDQKVAIKEYYPREFAVRDSTKTIHATGSAEDRNNFAWGLDRFREEAKTLARFSHPNVVAVRRLFEANGTSYIVMDFCEGAPLDQIIKRDAPLSKAVVEVLFKSLLDGLEHVHAAGVMHRDIKPANIFIRADGSPVLLDFGAARQALVSHSRSMTSLATAHYAAFEQYSTHGKQGAWTDIYGLAATLYHAATGEKPKDSPDRILEDTLEPLASKAVGRYPRDFLRAIDAGLAVRPEHRPQSVKEWRAQLEPARQAVSSREQPAENSRYDNDQSAPEDTAQDPFKSSPFWFAAVLLFLGLCVAIFGLPNKSGDQEVLLQNESGVSLTDERANVEASVSEEAPPQNVSEEAPPQNGSSADIEASVAAALAAQQVAREYSKIENCPDVEEIWEMCSGTYYLENGDKYAGQWKDNQYSYGILSFKSGNSYLGKFKNDKFSGYGVYKFSSGNSYLGEFKNDNFNGYGRIVDEYGKIIEQGFYKDDKLQ